jgi:GNAT superfamily N-acetyltransferase
MALAPLKAGFAPGFVVVEAAGAHVAAALTLLPETLQGEVLPSRMWIAHPPDRPHEVLAAAAAVPVLHDPAAPGFRGIARVLAEYRRQGIGRALVREVAQDAAAWGTARLHAWFAHDAGSPEAAFLRALRFMPHTGVHHFIGTTTQALQDCGDRLLRLKLRGRVPPDARLVPLHEADLSAVARLYASHLGGSPAELSQRLAKELDDGLCRALSVAVLCGPHLAGFMLMQHRDGLPLAELWISDPSYRHGWASLVSLHGALQRCLELGATQHRFHCNDAAVATLNFARRSGARQVALQHAYRLEFAQ